jgi:hypothetical protein
LERPVQRDLTAAPRAAVLGLAGTVLVALTLATGLPYLGARLGLGAPLPLAAMDGPHVAAGLAGAVLLAGKVLHVAARWHGAGAVPWRRLVAWSLPLLYGAVLLSGTMALLPLHGRLYQDALNLHLMTSAWAMALTAWHLWHHRRLVAPALRGTGRRAASWRLRLGLVLAVLPALAVSPLPRGVSQLPAVMGGATWSVAGLSGVPLARLAPAPDGRTLLAAGDRVYAGRDGGGWLAIALSGEAAGAFEFVPGGHGHGPAHATQTAVQSLAVSPAGVYAGTPAGLLHSAALDGPLADAGLPGQDVEAVAVDPADPRVLWTASTAGALLSADGGRTWTAQAAGLAEPERLTSIAFAAGTAFASDPTGVFAWSGQAAWRRVSAQAAVVSLTTSPDGLDLYATSGSGEIRRLSAGTWHPLAAPAPVHVHGGEPHAGVQDVVAYAGRLFAAGTAGGVSASADGGQTWTQLGGAGVDAPAQVIAFEGALWAATSNGLYRYPLTRSLPASAGWWLGLLTMAAAGGLGALALAGGRPRPPRPRR